MPRYFFHLHHYEPVRDLIGIELPDLAAAKCEAFEVVGRRMCESPLGFWDAETCQVTAATREGLTLFVLDVMVALAPAARDARAAG